MKIPIYHVDAFTDRPFTGNPAAVCFPKNWPQDSILQSIAAENNLSETAFVVPDMDGYQLRWFTPTVEVDLCGHATLASAYVLYECLGLVAESVKFFTASGTLTVVREGEKYAMDFPSRPPQACEVHPDLHAGLRASPKETLAARDYFCVFENEAQVRALTPDFGLMAGLDRFAVIATASGEDCDFVSRFFAPAQGINEDPVTGSAHCTLIPYWAKQLGKSSLFARQLSARGGEIWCGDQDDRVKIAGKAVLYAEGEILL